MIIRLFAFIYSIPRLWRKLNGKQTPMETMQEYYEALKREGKI